MRHYFIRGKYIASAKPTWYRVHGILTFPWGTAFFCPICSEIWAIATIENRETYVTSRLCDKHVASPSRGLPGSLWIHWEPEWNKDLPTELLTREYLIHLKMHEDGYANDMTHLNGV